MKAFATEQRVHVTKDEDDNPIDQDGTVTRVCTDGERAWIELGDKGSGKKVRAYAEDCELATTTWNERHAAAQIAKEPSVTIALFGKDHWSTFAYIETLCVDGNGTPSRDRMRCHANRHPFLVGVAGDGSAYPTRLKGGATLTTHDDWDCASDFEAFGLIENVGSSINPVFRLTEKGYGVAAQLRKHKAEGGNFSNFQPETERTCNGSCEPMCTWCNRQADIAAEARVTEEREETT